MNELNVMKKSNTDTHQNLIAQFHPTKNGTFKASEVRPGSMKVLWWKCEKGPDHEWQASPNSRGGGKYGCPFCAGKKPSITNTLVSLFPQIAKDWHPKKNAGMELNDIIAKSNVKVWWQCPNSADHEWQTAVSGRTSKGTGCPFCTGQRASSTHSLAIKHPKIAEEWHPIKNGPIKPEQIVPGSNEKVWWLCSAERGHEWQATVNSRSGGRGCPFCSNKKVGTSNSLADLNPSIASQWHPSKNGSLTPQDLGDGSNRKVWWKCSGGPDHEWQATIVNRTKNNSGCPYCTNQKVSSTNNLQISHPYLAAQWHPTKNKYKVTNVIAGSGQKAWWVCPDDSNHEWEASISSRSGNNRGCPVCAGRLVSDSTSLATKMPEIAAQWHPTKNKNLTPNNVTVGSSKKVWWKCSNGPDHDWEAKVSQRTLAKGATGCPFCSNKLASKTNSLATRFPDVAKEWHPKKNDDLTPETIVSGSNKKVWWQCLRNPDHEWETTVDSRTRAGRNCPYCSNQRLSKDNSLSTRFPKIAMEWDYDKNGAARPDNIISGSKKKFWWKCSSDPAHSWAAIVQSRTRGSGCPYCNQGWTLEAIRLFVSSLIDNIKTFTPAELYLLFQQNGLLGSNGKGKAFIKALTTGKFPKEELEKFAKGEESLVDSFVDNPELTLESLNDDSDALHIVTPSLDPLADAGSFPLIETKEILDSLGHSIFTSADEEAAKFLLASAVAKIWKHAYTDEITAVKQAKQHTGEGYQSKVRETFLEEYSQAKTLKIPSSYSFKLKNKLVLPNLMQMHFASKVKSIRRLGNWSGTGAGKTLASILATRVVDSKFTVVCCPNSVVEGWKGAIEQIFPDCSVTVKTFTPKPGKNSYLILNYEALQQPDSANHLQTLIETAKIDFIIIDEIHYAKQRTAENMSLRRQMVGALTTLAAEKNSDLFVLGLSATPVINNLQEGKGLVELVSGLSHDDIDIHPTIPNCMMLHQKLTTLGIRWMPDYSKMLGYECREEIIDVDCETYLPELRKLERKSNPLHLEQILTKARLSVILEHIKPKTLLYTYLISGIDNILYEAISAKGWKVGFYTGEDKTGKDAFIHGDLDVLIATAAIGTGVDGLQQVCNHLIINVLPWTRAEYEQLLGRIYRQGQVSKKQVTVVIPRTYAQIHGERWSWCDSKLQRLAYKKSLADSAVDGVVPEGHLRSQGQAYQDVMGWLERLDSGKLEKVSRPIFSVPLPPPANAKEKKRFAEYGDFSKMNRIWNQAKSQTTAERLKQNPEEWAHYHTLYQEARQDWSVVPFKEMAAWCDKRPGRTIGDFGCGEAKLSEILSDKNTVYSFDHIAINENVTECDIANVPLEDAVLDVAVFSLSLMGSNFTEYIQEAYRTLKLDGELHIFEATSRFSDRNTFLQGLRDMGFVVVSTEDKWKFTHIRSLKTERMMNSEIQLQF